MSAEDQRRAFCDLAERSIRDQVQANRELIVGSLRQVGTPDFVQQELPNTIERVKNALGLDDEKAAKLEPEYERLWRSHGDDLHAAFSREPFDDEAASRAVRSFWQDEDKMISGRYGPSALDTYRSSQLQGRTAFLTIFASLGGKPFDSVASW